MLYTKCPHCGATLSVPEEYKDDKRLHCSQCEQNFDNTIKVEKEKPSSAPKRPKRKKKHKLYWKEQAKFLGFVAVICFLLYKCGACESSGSLHVGDQVTVVSNTWGTIDKDASDKLGRSRVADDSFGTYELVHDGKAQFIWKGSSGRIVRASWFKVQVRFNDGSLYWVSSDAVRKK